MLGHLHNGWQVDQAILSEEDRVVVSNHRKIALKNYTNDFENDF